MSASFQIAGADDGNIMLVNGSEVETGTASTPLRIDPTGATTQPISAVSLPLPSGASTSALQTTGNTSLSSIDIKTPALGQTTMSASQPVTIASNQTAIPTAYNDIAPATQNITAFDTGTSTFVGANSQNFYIGAPTANSTASFALSAIGTVAIEATLIGAGGTMVVEVSMDGGSFWLRPNVFQVSTQSYSNGFTSPFIAVVNTAGMTNIRVRGTVSWSGTATIAVKETINQHMVTIGDALPGGTNSIGSIGNISGTISLPTGAATAALQTAGNALLTTIDAGIPTSLGQTTMSASMPVTLSSDQSALPVSQSGTWNINNVSGTVSLPTGAATSANQSTEITALQLIDNIIGPVTPGTVATASSLIGGQFNTVLPVLTNTQQAAAQFDSSGRLIIAPLTAASSITTSAIPVDGIKATYSSTITGLVVPALATDIFTITGSGTKTIRILQVGISATAAADTKVNTVLIKRSAANTGGTSSTPAIIPHDSTSAAATAVIRAYTANPSGLGATVGTLRTVKFDAIGTSTVVPMVPIFDFGNRPGQAIVLRGTAEVLAVNLSATTVITPSFNVWIEFTEE